jgi:hypothetical protein
MKIFISKNAFSSNIVVIPYLITFPRQQIVLDVHKGMFQYKDISGNLYTKQNLFPLCIAVSPFRYTSINIPYFMAFPLP